VKAPYFLVAELAPSMAQRGERGAIVNVSTIGRRLRRGGPEPLWVGGKAAINLLTKVWAAEYGPQRGPR